MHGVFDSRAVIMSLSHVLSPRLTVDSADEPVELADSEVVLFVR